MRSEVRLRSTSPNTQRPTEPRVCADDQAVAALERGRGEASGGRRRGEGIHLYHRRRSIHVSPASETRTSKRLRPGPSWRSGVDPDDEGIDQADAAGAGRLLRHPADGLLGDPEPDLAAGGVELGPEHLADDHRGPDGLFGSPVGDVYRRVPQEEEHGREFGGQMVGEAPGVGNPRRGGDESAEPGFEPAADRGETVLAHLSGVAAVTGGEAGPQDRQDRRAPGTPRARRASPCSRCRCRSRPAIGVRFTGPRGASMPAAPAGRRAAGPATS